MRRAPLRVSLRSARRTLMRGTREGELDGPRRPEAERLRAGSRSPNLDAVLRGQVEGLAGLDLEGLVPGVEVADGVGPVLVGGVAVAEDLLAEQRLAGLAPPA